jgi:hypothetical protein
MLGWVGGLGAVENAKHENEAKREKRAITI